MAQQRHKDKGAKARPKRTIPVRAKPDGSDLCLQCGLCCDGTLFSNVIIEADERDFVESLGLSIEPGPNGESLTMLQPCPAFIDGCCSLYERGRPNTCDKYSCGLLTGFEAERAGLDDCLAVVRLVWSLSRELEVEMGLPLGSYNRGALQAYLREHKPWDAPADHVVFLIAFHRLNVLGNKYFGYKALASEERAAAAGEEIAADAAAGAGLTG